MGLISAGCGLFVVRLIEVEIIALVLTSCWKKKLGIQGCIGQLSVITGEAGLFRT
ncbi:MULTISPECIES: hypothetical protein [unclassified Endozoicomonas]|uniref:hypothetical protein n=1 Tax=unclassified Endozoicomonas TaxID=2644528 RepID=UPI0021484A45|nr:MULTISPECIES: hypothetical protein [unclassified Endozoicomonas]